MKKLSQSLLVAVTLALSTMSLTVHAALAIIAHPSNPLSGITAEEAERLYLGKTDEFSNGRHATPVDQAAGSTMRTKFYRSVIKKDDAELKAYWSRLVFTGKGQPPRELADDAAVKAFVAGNPDAIGYVDGKFVDSSVKVLLILP